MGVSKIGGSDRVPRDEAAFALRASECARTRLTEREVAHALAEAYKDRGEDAPGVYSTAEVAAALDVSERKAREFIRQAIAEGKMEPTRVEKRALDGIVRRSSAYRFVDG